MTSSDLIFSAVISHRGDPVMVTTSSTSTTTTGEFIATSPPSTATLTIFNIYSSVTERHCAILGDAIVALLRVRDSLGIQLDFALGNLSEADFETQLADYLHHNTIPSHEIIERSSIILKNVKHDIDLETLSTMLGLAIETVAAAIAPHGSRTMEMIDDGSRPGE